MAKARHVQARDSGMWRCRFRQYNCRNRQPPLSATSVCLMAPAVAFGPVPAAFCRNRQYPVASAHQLFKATQPGSLLWGQHALALLGASCNSPRQRAKRWQWEPRSREKGQGQLPGMEFGNDLRPVTHMRMCVVIALCCAQTCLTPNSQESRAYAPPKNPSQAPKNAGACERIVSISCIWRS